MGVRPEGAAILAGQPKVTDLEVPLVVVQDVGGLQVPVDDPIVMQVGNAGYQLPHQRLDLHMIGKGQLHSKLSQLQLTKMSWSCILSAACAGSLEGNYGQGEPEGWRRGLVSA